ncbi:MAG: hypothetical protein J2P36_37150 [Ktedonobacteraceae bacterium]|nr:hypothetical protein [Ktedonobacteraceae bacterium]
MYKKIPSITGMLCLIMIMLAGCGSAAQGGGDNKPPTPKPTQAATATATAGNNATFKITQVDMSVTPSSIAGMACGSNVTVVYKATLHAPANNPGGTAALDYTVNNGRSSAAGSVAFQPGETEKTFVFQWSGKLETDHVYPGQGGVQVTMPNQITSSMVKPSGECALNAPFKVNSVGLTVSPSSIAGVACGTHMTFTYTATFHMPAYSPGGTIKFSYTLNNGRSEKAASVSVAPGETTKTYTFTATSDLPDDHTSPGIGIVMVTNPNNVLSPGAYPAGTCH